MTDLADVLGPWLLGGFDGVPVDTRRESGIPAGANGVLERILTTFQGDPVGPSQSAVSLNAAVGLTVPDQALSAIVSIEAQAARLKFDGAPTAASGLAIPAGTILAITGRASMKAAQFIGQVAGGLLSVHYFT